jgi:hypothetical protein
MTTNSFTKLIGNKATVATKKSAKKSTAPVIKLTPELSDELDILVEAKAEVKAAQAKQKQAEVKLIEHAQGVQDANGMSGNYSGTYELSGENYTSKFISSDRFSVSQDSDVHEELVELVGQDNFDNMVNQEMVVQLRGEVFQSPELQDMLVQLIGDKFDDLFETTIKYSAKKGLKDNIYNLVSDVDELVEVRELMPQYKPSIR